MLMSFFKKMKTNRNQQEDRQQDRMARNGKTKPSMKFSGKIVRRIRITTNKDSNKKESGGEPKRLIDYPILPGPGFSML